MYESTTRCRILANTALPTDLRRTIPGHLLRPLRKRNPSCTRSHRLSMATPSNPARLAIVPLRAPRTSAPGSPAWEVPPHLQNKTLASGRIPSPLWPPLWPLRPQLRVVRAKCRRRDTRTSFSTLRCPTYPRCPPLSTAPQGAPSPQRRASFRRARRAACLAGRARRAHSPTAYRKTNSRAKGALSLILYLPGHHPPFPLNPFLRYRPGTT